MASSKTTGSSKKFQIATAATTLLGIAIAIVAWLFDFWLGSRDLIAPAALSNFVQEGEIKFKTRVPPSVLRAVEEKDGGNSEPEQPHRRHHTSAQKQKADSDSRADAEASASSGAGPDQDHDEAPAGSFEQKNQQQQKIQSERTRSEAEAERRSDPVEKEQEVTSSVETASATEDEAATVTEAAAQTPSQTTSSLNSSADSHSEREHVTPPALEPDESGAAKNDDELPQSTPDFFFSSDVGTSQQPPGIRDVTSSLNAYLQSQVGSGTGTEDVASAALSTSSSSDADGKNLIVADAPPGAQQVPEAQEGASAASPSSSEQQRPLQEQKERQSAQQNAPPEIPHEQEEEDSSPPGRVLLRDYLGDDNGGGRSSTAVDQVVEKYDLLYLADSDPGSCPDCAVLTAQLGDIILRSVPPRWGDELRVLFADVQQQVVDEAEDADAGGGKKNTSLDGVVRSSLQMYFPRSQVTLRAGDVGIALGEQLGVKSFPALFMVDREQGIVEEGVDFIQVLKR